MRRRLIIIYTASRARRRRGGFKLTPKRWRRELQADVSTSGNGRSLQNAFLLTRKAPSLMA